MRTLWRDVEPLMNGTHAMRVAPHLMPRWPNEEHDSYTARVQTATLFPAYRRTISVMAGKPFSKPLTLSDDTPELIVSWANDIDLEGVNLHAFAAEMLQEALAFGLAGILVDAPPPVATDSPIGPTVADQQRAGVRPYFVRVRHDQVLGWRMRTVAGRAVLTQLRLAETDTIEDGAFGEKVETRYRVFTRSVGPAGPVIAFRLLRVSEDKKVIVDAEGTYPTQREIPVAEVPTAGRVSLFESEPPLLDLGYLNIAHYQQASDAAQSRHMTCVPFLFTAGFEMANEYGQPMTVGTNSGLNTSNADGKAMYVSHDGAALAECRAALTELRNDIGALGLAMLAPDQRAAETATAKRLDRAAESSALAVTARGVQDAVERALGFHARYLRLEDGGSVTINRDYDAELMDAQTMQAYGALATALGLPTVEVLKMLQRGGRLADDLDLEALALEMDAARIGAEDAAAVQARLDAEDAMDAADPARQDAEDEDEDETEDAD
jgi:hypothetical protein